MIKDLIAKALEEVTGTEDIKLDTPSDKNHGDWASSVALTLGKRQQRNPKELAREIISKLEDNYELKKVVEKIETAGPGFINFFINDNALSDNIKEVVDKGDKYGCSNNFIGQKVVVEYSSPNIAKPFGIGHFRSTIIGDAVANLLEACGATVYRDNHLGDWGTQFGKQIYAIKTWGTIDEIEKSANPVKELVNLYIKFHEEAVKDPSLEDKGRVWFKKLEEGDLEARDMWQKCVNWSLKEFGRVYKTLGVKFTENDGLGYGESYFEHMMQPVIEELTKKGLLKDGKEGARIIEFPNEKFPPLMIVKADGATLYATRDLAADKFRLGKYGEDVIIINEVGAEQTLYFQQLFELERMLTWTKEGQRVHIKHGLFRLKDRKMSTRKGDVIWLEEVISQAIEKARKFGSDEKLSKAVAIAALKWNELKRDPIKDIIFDWDEILSMDGNSGPYLQYTHARIFSILTKGVPEKESISKPLDEKEKLIARVLVHYPEILENAAKNYSPHILASYLFELAQTFNNFYNSERVLGGNREGIRLLLTMAAGQVIKNGLSIFGIEAPERM